ncbi:YebC/PmpR family DNA-binding transcriptional regulator [Neofamilia massiliensis]|uniref:YebC/PmpR family DNA-binding transcriptional regulator n=1 Tax=Neofamilia massiliensis TaxID=1673724 RepID=UPI0006BB7D94|nr:YebC/PmpR family DNA-binding transcriptional regulator [Neofamilia massiliensis]
MSGHSKWSNIKHKKGKEDAKKAKVFAKMSRYITVAARTGGLDPEFNPELKVAIDKAKSENMPNDNIERALKKAAGDQAAADFEEILYEGYGPSGVAVMVTALTDNRNRTAPDVRHAFDKNGGNLGTTGCVSFMFDKLGTIIIEKSDKVDEDDLTLQAIDLGADDIEVLDDAYEITTSPENFLAVKNGLEEAGFEIAAGEIGYLPQNYVDLEDEEDIKKMTKLIDMLEDHDDVQEVFHNWNMPEEDWE